ncbi:epsin-1-like isoform X2 [Ruditapes philippinarum]|uniref:epsin-1-like isoform X2 n=1 Tax=Ruditapes philippinarum TaxID=129788 RepID=UPI00295A624B|nr:epsin-1-like isoform X2 [Ruditapes philippinarum]
MPMRRTLKNVVKNYTDAQVKVREATSNDPWGPSSTLMTEIADLTYNVVAFTEIMQMLWKRLNDHGKNWRHVYKSLAVLDYIIKTGSEKVAQQCKENIFAIQTLKDFQYTEDNKDQGINVREKAKQLVQLLKDDERLRNERAKALKAKERFAQNSQGVGSQPSRSASAESPTFQSGSGGYSDSALDGYDTGNSPVRRRRHSNEMEAVRPSSIGEEELQLQLALAMSREEHEEEVRKQKSDDIKLQLALDESRRQQEEEGTGQMTLAGLADQSKQRQQSDPWGAPTSKPPSDPWGAPLPAPPSSHKHHAPPPANDPWASPAHQPSQPPPQPQADPWSSPAMSSPAQQKPAGDPWGTPSSQQGAWDAPLATGGSPYDPFQSNGTSNGMGNNLDDDFDVLSSRMSPAKTTETTGQNLDMFDPLAEKETTIDPWNLSGMQSSIANEQPKRNKTPQEFLGTHSGLVNLDELVKSDQNSKKANNPFATAPSTNPFEQQAPVRIPMSQLQANTYNSGFTQPSSAGLLPAPLMPMATPMQQQQQSSNPFL